MGPWGPKGPMPPGGFFGPFGAPRAPSGAPGDSGGAPGAPRRLPGHFWKNPDFGPEPASGHGPRNLAPEPLGLATEPSELATEPSELATEPSGLATDPSGRVPGLTSGVWTDIGCLDWGRMPVTQSGATLTVGGYPDSRGLP